MLVSLRVRFYKLYFWDNNIESAVHTFLVVKDNNIRFTPSLKLLAIKVLIFGGASYVQSVRSCVSVGSKPTAAEDNKNICMRI